MRMSMKASYYPDRLRTIQDALRVNTRDMQIMTRNADAVFRKQSEKVFQTEGAAGGEPWDPLSPAYAARKAGVRTRIARENRWTKRLKLGNKFGPFMERPVSQKIMQWTGNLMRSFTRAGHSQHIAKSEGPLTRPIIVLGSSNELAFYHYEGIETFHGKIIRNTIQRTSEQMDELLETLRTYMIVKARDVARSLRRGSNARGVRR